MGSTERYPWKVPGKDHDHEEEEGLGLFVSNSLTGTKVRFCPSGGGRTVKWYICGPTVYDSAHLGHARTYMAFDVVRRIMEDYFGYEMLGEGDKKEKRERLREGWRGDGAEAEPLVSGGDLCWRESRAVGEYGLAY
mmetsp:Transcript_8191/g.16546  ORF Transcript_8191/g.16546 Transcript_8191/m.16546 type:complete len:136 (+) Transcript_8191:48-455(+)